MKELLIVMSVTIALGSSHAGCPNGFEEFNHSCYIFGETTVPNYRSAFNICSGKGGYLVNINAGIENKYVVEKLRKQHNRLNGWWMGGSYSGETWVWRKISQESVIPMDPNGFFDWGQNLDETWISAGAKVAMMKNGVPQPFKWYAYNNWDTARTGMSYICEADYEM